MQHSNSANVAQPPPAAVDLLIDGRPDWLRIDFALDCPRCGYDVRMLDTPRCPECGLEFSWHDLLHARFTTNRFLFEHQWRKRPIRSWFVTAAKSFRPRRFWSEISLYDRVHVGPLWFFVLPSVLLFFALLHGLTWLGNALLTLVATRVPLSPTWDMVNVILAGFALPNISRNPQVLFSDWGFVCMLFGALGTLLLLRDTLGRCRVRNVQVFRVVAYSALLGAVIFFVTLVVVYLLLSCASLILPDPPPILLPLVAFLAIATPFGLLLARALKRYLRLPRPYLLGVTAAFIGILTAAAIPAAILQLFRLV
jgi:hypothetical protein